MSEISHNKQTALNFYSRLAGRIANSRRPKFFVKFLIYSLRKIYSIDLDEYIIPKDRFQTFNTFFTRRIKPERREIGSGIISPIDGIVYDFGAIDSKRRIFVKQKYFDVSELVKSDNTKFNSFVVLYLSPANYHRVHAPFDMKINQIKYIPGTLKSVRDKTVQKKRNLYCRNERILVNGSSEYGNFTFILVGALMVGKIKLSFETNTQSNIKKADSNILDYSNSIAIKKGEELGYFEFGSSVIILLEEEYLKAIPFKNKQTILLGETIYN